MLCDEFRLLMFERLAGELSSEQERACSTHEQSCVICRAELADTKWISTRLRAGWPSEEPMPIRLQLPEERGARHWFDVSAVWFSRASAALVMACLLAVVLLRPSVAADAHGLRIAFGAPVNAPVVAASLNAEQVKAMVAAEVQKAESERAVAVKSEAQAGRVLPAAAAGNGQVVEVAQ